MNFVYQDRAQYNFVLVRILHFKDDDRVVVLACGVTGKPVSSARPHNARMTDLTYYGYAHLVGMSRGF